MNKLIQKIYGTYRVGDPIFPSEILGLLNLSRQMVYVYIKEGLLLGQIKKVDGYYYIPKYENVCGIEVDNKPDYVAVLEKKYITNGDRIYGVYSNGTLENMLNIYTQVPAIRTIITNKTSKNKERIKIGEYDRAIIKKPYTKIKNDNQYEYMLLQLFNENKDIAKETRGINRINSFVKKYNIKKDRVIKLSKKFPKKAMKRLLASGIELC